MLPLPPDREPLPRELRCALRESFRGAGALGGAWKEALSACAGLLASLGNVARQALALRKAFLPGPGPPPPPSSLGAFPDLPRRLALKHRGAAEALLAQLWQHQLPELRKVRDAASFHAAKASLLQEATELGPEASFQRSPLRPSLADLMEGLLDIEAFYHRTYLEAKLLLLQIRFEDLEEMQALPEAWEQVMQHGLQSTVVDDALLKVSFFLEEAA